MIGEYERERVCCRTWFNRRYPKLSNRFKCSEFIRVGVIGAAYRSPDFVVDVPAGGYSCLFIGYGICEKALEAMQSSARECGCLYLGASNPYAFKKVVKRYMNGEYSIG